MSLVQELHQSVPWVHKSKRPQPHLVINIYMYIYNPLLMKKKINYLLCEFHTYFQIYSKVLNSLVDLSRNIQNI